MEQKTSQSFPQIDPLHEHTQLFIESGNSVHKVAEHENALLAHTTILSEVETLLEAIPDAIFQLDTQGYIESYNIAAQNLCIRVLPEFPSDFATVMSICRQQDGDAQGQLFTGESMPFARLLQGEILLGSVAPTVSVTALDGQEMYLQISGKPLQDEQGQLSGILVVVRDMTAPHQLRQDLEETLVKRLLEQRRLQERQQRVLHLSSSLAEYAYVYQITPDEQLHREWISDTFLNLIEYTAEELDLLGWNVIKLCHPDDLPRAVARIAAMHAGEPDDQEWRVITKSGLVYWLHDVCYCMKDEETGFTRVYGVAKNITERKEAEQQMWQLNQQMDVTFEAIADGIVVMGRDGEILRMNSAARDLMHLVSLDPEFTAHPLAQRLAAVRMRDNQGQPLPLEQTPHYRVLHGETLQNSGNEDVQVTALDGHGLTINVGGAPIHAANGQLLGAVLILRDVTLRYQQEQRKQQALFTLLQMAEAVAQFPDQSDTAGNNSQQISADMLALTRDLFESQLGCILTIEAETERFQPIAVSGGSASEQASIYERLACYHLSEFFDQEQLSMLQAGEALLIDVEQSPALATILATCGMKTVLVAPLYVRGGYPGLICIDGSDVERIYPFHEALTLLKAVGKLIALVIERERLMRARTAAEAYSVAEREVSRQKDEFLSLASHELRTPLATIKACIQIARRRLKRFNDAQEAKDSEQANVVAQQVITMLNRGEQQVSVEHRLIDDLLDVSYIQEQRLDLQPTLFNLAKLVKQVITAMASEENSHPLILNESVAEQSFPVIADRRRIEQVLMNYISNAIKYSFDEAPIELKICRDERMVRVEVSDQGPGVALAEQMRIWERFYQIPDRIIYQGSAGMGLGLYISQVIIRQHHGQVGVDSSLQSGSTFWFTLPLTH
ncbi:PAS domain-containing sensor histidine kinase [Dictyobacter kobayashii]|uniref:histidine kinase n=1 Tax=Dictyobacter kobayashii TaxID=2014872 RepID=A0A402AXL7_9CHLR|nr:PAS domain S-box protein [Dictyobacter kobayashii]GCE23804.1 hypothetical protein KDK_76040 [Dictyobacter kobayashii]